MRVVEYDNWGTSPESVLKLSADFARLDADAHADPAIGGFRILQPRPVQRQWAWRPASRLPASGFLATVLIGGFGLAVLAGPATCPCGTLPSAQQTAATAPLARLAYANGTVSDLGDRLRAHPITPAKVQLPKLVTVALHRPTAAPTEPEAPTLFASPISTAAIPIEAPATETRLSGPPERTGLLPGKIVSLSDTAPKPVQLAAVAPADSVTVQQLSVTDMTMQKTPELPHMKPKVPPVAKASHKPQVVTHAKPRKDYRAAPETTQRLTRRERARRSPRWSQQLYANPWQTKAFSYLR
jgi:hypothetical protein